MGAGRWVLVGIAGVIMIFSIIRTAQGADYRWATGLAMILVMVGLLLSGRRNRQQNIDGTGSSSADTPVPATR